MEKVSQKKLRRNSPSRVLPLQRHQVDPPTRTIMLFFLFFIFTGTTIQWTSLRRNAASFLFFGSCTPKLLRVLLFFLLLILRIVVVRETPPHQRQRQQQQQKAVERKDVSCSSRESECFCKIKFPPETKFVLFLSQLLVRPPPQLGALLLLLLPLNSSLDVANEARELLVEVECTSSSSLKGIVVVMI